VELNSRFRSFFEQYIVGRNWHDYLDVLSRFHRGASQLLAEKYPQLPDPGNAGEGKRNPKPPQREVFFVAYRKNYVNLLIRLNFKAGLTSDKKAFP